MLNDIQYHLKSTLLLLGGLAAGLLCAELFLRIFFTSYKFEAMSSPEFQWGLHDSQPKYRPSALLGHELIPNSTNEVNSFGMRDKEYSLKKSKGTVRILLLGDSICQLGYWSDYVEDMLNSGGKYEILNTGTSAWGLEHYFRYLINRGLKYSPDFVLIGLCLNDLNNGDIPTIVHDYKKKEIGFYHLFAGPGSKKNISSRVNPLLFKKSYLYRFVIIQTLKINFFNQSHQEYIKSNNEKLLEMKQLVNGRMAAVIFPYLRPLAQYSNQDILKYHNILESLEKTGVPYLDLTPPLNRYGQEIIKFRRDPQDYMHFNDEGDKITAAIIFPWLLNKLKVQAPREAL